MGYLYHTGVTVQSPDNPQVLTGMKLLTHYLYSFDFERRSYHWTKPCFIRLPGDRPATSLPGAKLIRMMGRARLHACIFVYNSFDNGPWQDSYGMDNMTLCR